MGTLFILSYPIMGCFYGFVSWVGWIDVSLGMWGWVGFTITVCPHSINIAVAAGNWTDHLGRLVYRIGTLYDLVLLVQRPGS